MDQVLGQFIGRFHRIDPAQGSERIQPGHLVTVLQELDKANVQVKGVKVSTSLRSARPGDHGTGQAHAQEVMDHPPAPNIGAVHLQHRFPSQHHPIRHGHVKGDKGVEAGKKRSEKWALDWN